MTERRNCIDLLGPWPILVRLQSGSGLGRFARGQYKSRAFASTTSRLQARFFSDTGRSNDLRAFLAFALVDKLFLPAPRRLKIALLATLPRFLSQPS
jgi:hypothetical protein